jgi:PilZ domain-containing protein
MEPFFQSVARAFSGNREALPRVELAILALLALAVLLQLAGILRRLLARRTRFHRLLASRGLGADDVRFAAALAAHGAVQPLELVTHLDVFERVTALALAPGAPWPDEAAPRIGRLRRALGWDRLPPHTPLLSTRELAPGTALEVALQPGTLAEVDESGFTVEVREPPAVPAGQQVALTLAHAREARYALGCRLAAAHPQPGGGWHLRFEHDEHPARQQQREYVRVPVDGPLALRPVTQWQPGLPSLAGDVQARLVDLSGGGAQASSRSALPVGALVRATFAVGGATFDGLGAVVLACQPEAAGGHRLKLEFTGRPGAERERLVAALTHLELEAQAAGRAGASSGK